MSKDLISREAAKKALAGRFDVPTHNEIVRILDKLPSDILEMNGRWGQTIEFPPETNEKRKG